MTTNNYKQLVTELKKYNETSNTEIYVPSLNKTISFKPLTVKQQTDIITGVLNAQKSKNLYDYQNIVDSIIIANCDESSINSVLALDRACILIQFRLDTIGETVEIEGQTYSLTEHVATFKDKPIDIGSISNVCEHKGITATCTVPTLQQETKINADTSGIFKDGTTERAVGKVFLIELAKHIQHISFDKNEIDFTQLSIKQQIQICEMLPMTLSQQIIKYIETVRALEEQFVKISTPDGLVSIPIDSQLFNK
tara:strand:- start:305 stop:1063 length:759 start_codon:yes stop_codon:yes gene_type:complete